MTVLISANCVQGRGACPAPRGPYTCRDLLQHTCRDDWSQDSVMLLLLSLSVFKQLVLCSRNSLVWSFEGVIILSEEVADGCKINVDPRSGVGVGSGPGVPLSCRV